MLVCRVFDFSTPVFLPGEFYGQRSLVGYTVHGIAKSGTRLSHTHTHTHTRNLYESLAGESILGCKSSPFITLNISCYSLLNCRVSAEKSADNLMGILLCVIYWFSLVVFSIFSLYLILLVSLICVSA